MGFEELDKLRKGQLPQVYQPQQQEMTVSEDDGPTEEEMLMQAYAEQGLRQQMNDPLMRGGPAVYTREREIEAMDGIKFIGDNELWTVNKFMRVYGQHLGYLNVNNAMALKLQKQWNIIVMLSRAEGMELTVHSKIQRYLHELQMTKSNGENGQIGLTGVTKWFSQSSKNEQIVRMMPSAPGQGQRQVTTMDKIKRAFGRG